MVVKRIHFIGRKDSFRGRLAVAYGTAIGPNEYIFTSSGVDAAHERVQMPDMLARTLAKTVKCDTRFSKQKQQTTSSQMKRQDIIIFLSKDVYDSALKKFTFDARKCLLWDIEDIETTQAHQKLTKQVAASKSWQKLAVRLRIFLDEVTHSRWCDVYDEHNTSLGYRLPAAWIDGRKGLWRRATHTVITTADHRFVVERRTSVQMRTQRSLHLSMDGIVWAAETPREAVMRQIHRKFGVTLRPEQAAFQNVKKFRKVMRHQMGSDYSTRYSNTFVYTYHVALTIDNPLLLPEGDHSREIVLIGRRALLWALKYPAPSMKRHLTYGRKHYTKAVKRAKIYPTNH